MKNLSLCLIQSHLIWENATENLLMFDEKINAISGEKHIIILPETFNTGFSLHAPNCIEKMDGKTIAWMQEKAKQKNSIICGSLFIHENGKNFNRLCWVMPNGEIQFYDKRHLFSYAKENEHFTEGEKRIIVQVQGWKILLQICYDLRFPVFARQQFAYEYDAILYIANWPAKRIEAWNSLLKARAIENQSFCIGLNRVGDDGFGINYNGCSSVYDPLGKQLLFNENDDTSLQIEIKKEDLEQVRNQFPFLKDKDDFFLK